MSTLKVTNLQDTAGANSATTAQIYSGIAKAWVNFNGTGTVAIRASFNVSSITDNGVGRYSVNFTTAMTDANYCIDALGIGGPANGVFSFIDNNISTTTTSCPIAFNGGTGPAYDSSTACVAIFR